MSKPSNLVLNLNEIMEEYTEREEEIVQETQANIEEEERVEARAMPEQRVEEIRNKKRGVEETGAKHSEGKASDWVSEMDFLAWRDKLQHKDFISGRASVSGSPPSKKLLRREDGFSFVSINPLVS